MRLCPPKQQIKQHKTPKQYTVKVSLLKLILTDNMRWYKVMSITQCFAAHLHMQYSNQDKQINLPTTVSVNCHNTVT